MPLEVATYINQLNTANPVGSDPLAQADDHLRLLKTTIKNTFPNIDGAMTVTDDVLNALPGRVTALEAGGGGGSGTGGIAIVATLPASGTAEGETVFNQADGVIYTWDGDSWVPVTLSTNYTPDVPEAIEIVTSLPGTATDGKVVFNTTDNKLYERVNGAWSEVTVTVNATQEVADGSITTAKFAQGIRPLEVVSSLPTTGNSEGRMVYLTTDDKIYRFTGTAFTSSLPFGDLTGTIAANQIAANTVTAAMIQAGAIGADQIAAGAISTAKLAAGAITAEKIAASAIDADKIATNAITSDKISANSITSGKIAAAAIGTSQLSASAITSDKIASGAITSGTIAAGAVTATAIASNAVTAAKIAAGTITVDKLTNGTGSFTGGSFSLGSGSSIAGYSGVGAFTASSGSFAALLGSSTSGMAGAVGTTSTMAAFGAYNSSSSSYTSHRTFAELATSTVAGYFINNNSSKWIQLANASFAFQTSGGATGSFTGAHDGLISKTAPQPTPGDIVVDVSVFASPNVYDSLCVNAMSTMADQKGVVGVLAEYAPEGHVPSAISKVVSDENGRSSIIVDPSYTDLGDYNMVLINGLGEGLINVCGQGGDIQVGDLITTSSIHGKGMKQSDDIVRSYTVAKAREAVTFGSPDEVKKIACIYVCG